MTDEQSERLAVLAMQYGGSRVGVMHDADGPGDEGAKESLWRMHELGINAYLVWSRRKFAGQFVNRHPETITNEEWKGLSSKVALLKEDEQ